MVMDKEPKQITCPRGRTRKEGFTLDSNLWVTSNIPPINILRGV
jgi:hypothetical protein